MALLAGFIISPLVADNQLLVWVLFFAFTFLHLFANYRAVCCVVMETLNLTRLQISLTTFLTTATVLPPKQLAKLDPVLSYPAHTYRIKPGSRLQNAMKSGARSDRLSTTTPPMYVVGVVGREV